MIQKLTEQDRGNIIAYLSEEKDFNIFIIGDIENYGFDAPFQDVWAVRDGNEMQGVLLRFHDTFIPYAKERLPAMEFITIVQSYPCKTIMGKGDVIEQLIEGASLTVSETAQCMFARLDALRADIPTDSPFPVSAATGEVLDRIISFHREIEEFSSRQSESYARIVRNNLETNSGRCYYIEIEEQIVSTALTSAETSHSSMIMGVATKSEHRMRGLGTACLVKLCGDLLREGKTPCLFYDNPQAGTIYRKLGFIEIGTWTTCQITGGVPPEKAHSSLP